MTCSSMSVSVATTSKTSEQMTTSAMRPVTLGKRSSWLRSQVTTPEMDYRVLSSMAEMAGHSSRTPWSQGTFGTKLGLSDPLPGQLESKVGFPVLPTWILKYVS